MSKDVLIFGAGYWGQIISSKIQEIGYNSIIQRSKDSFPPENINVNWVFIATPPEKHFYIAKYYLERNVNVFIEKPPTLDIESFTQLAQLAQRNSAQFIVSNVFLWRNELANKTLNSTFFRSKKLKFVWNHPDISRPEIAIIELLYHDLYILIANSRLERINNQRITLSNNNSVIVLEDCIGEITIEYNLGTPKKKFISNDLKDTIIFEQVSQDPLKQMITAFIEGKLKSNLDLNFKCMKVFDLVITDLKEFSAE